MQRLVFPILLTICVAVLAACGQKGPLYLPNAPQAEPAPTAPNSNADERADAANNANPAEPDQ